MEEDKKLASPRARSRSKRSSSAPHAPHLATPALTVGADLLNAAAEPEIPDPPLETQPPPTSHSSNPNGTEEPGAPFTPSRSGFWSKKRIVERHEVDKIFFYPCAAEPEGKLVREIEPKQQRSASYNLLMGREVYVSPVEDNDPKTVQSLDHGEGFVIPPGQFAFLITDEAVHVPPDAIGLIALRGKALKFQGLINVSGFHVDPGYKGRLVIATYNAGPAEIHLRQGRPLFEIFFADLDQETEPYVASNGNSDIYHIEPSLISSVAGKFETLSNLKNKIDDVETDLDDRIRNLEREQTVTRWAAALILGALIAFGARQCTASPASAAQPYVESSTHA